MFKKPHAYFFGYISKALAKVSGNDSFVVRGHSVYLESGLIGGTGQFIMHRPGDEAVLKPTCELVEGVLVTCAIDEEGGALRLVSAMKPEV